MPEPSASSLTSQPRVLAIGDVHGCFTALRTLEKYVPWRADDQLVMLGDYVDRGPDSKAVIEWLIARHQRGGCVTLRGNHECIMLDAFHDKNMRLSWLEHFVGGEATLASYAPADSARPGRFTDVPQEHWDFIREKTQRYLETDTHLFVHAGVHPQLPMEEQPAEYLFWQHLRNNAQPPHYSGKTIVCGHTAQRDGLPLDLGHVICIDTYPAGQGWLTCFDPVARYCWQANQQGDFREGPLGELGQSDSSAG